MSNVQDLKEQIIKKAWENAEFKSQLLEDPKAAVKEAFGVEVPDDVEVVVTEETANKYYLAIPQNPKDLKGEFQVSAPMWE